MILRINRNVLIGMQMLSSKDDTRYVLCSLNIECTKAGQVVVTACDGRRLGTILTGEAIEPPKKKRSCIVSIDSKMLKALPRGIGDKGGDAMLTFGETHVKIQPFGVKSHSFECELIEGVYPNWRNVVPRSSCASPIDPCFDWTLLDGFAKALQVIGGSKLVPMILRQASKADAVNGQIPLMIYSTAIPHFVGVLSPLNDERGNRTAPAWAYTAPEPDQPEAPAAPAEKTAPAPASEKPAEQTVTA